MKKDKVVPKAPATHQSPTVANSEEAQQQVNMYTHAPEGTGSSKPQGPGPTQWQQMNTPLLPVGGKKL